MITQGDVDARLESFIEGANTVGRKEQDAAEVPYRIISC